MAHVSVFIFKKYIYFAAATLTRQKKKNIGYYRLLWLHLATIV